MESQTLHIKNMVCPRCEMVVKQTFDELGVRLLHLEIGRAEIEKVDAGMMSRIASRLETLGFALLNDPDSRLVETIKIACRQYLDRLEKELLITRLSDYLAAQIGKNYAYLSKLFSAREGLTIESYFLQLKIDRVKQLLSYGELSLSEIAARLQYSSVHYLSAQFKKIAGCTVTDYLKERKLA